MIENGMVVGAQEAYDAMCEEDAWATRTTDDVLDFAFNDGIAPDVIGWFLTAPTLFEGAAYELAEMIPEKRFVEMVEEYVNEKDLRAKYNEWKGG